MSVALVISVTPMRERGGDMWLTEVEKAIADIKAKYPDCCVDKIVPNWGGGINFHMSNFDVVVWRKGEIVIHKDGEWRNK